MLLSFGVTTDLLGDVISDAARFVVGAHVDVRWVLENLARLEAAKHTIAVELAAVDAIGALVVAPGRAGAEPFAGKSDQPDDGKGDDDEPGHPTILDT